MSEHRNTTGLTEQITIYYFLLFRNEALLLLAHAAWKQMEAVAAKTALAEARNKQPDLGKNTSTHF